MAKIVIELPGEPQAKERPRFGRHGKVYTPNKTAAYERSFSWAAKLAMKGQKPLTGPLKVTVTAFMGVPKSYRHQEWVRAMAGNICPSGDVDNFAKSVLDACNKIVYLDDVQVVELIARKQYATEPMTRIEVEPIFDTLVVL